MDPALVFQPEELYDTLDESISGIAEFLLPLVYGGHVNHIAWIKPHWAQQVSSCIVYMMGIVTSCGSTTDVSPVVTLVDADSVHEACACGQERDDK